MTIKYQKLKRAKFSGKGTEINELILGIIKKGESLDIKKLKDKIKTNLGQFDSVMRHAWCALVGEGFNVSQNWYPSKCLRVDCFAAVQL